MDTPTPSSDNPVFESFPEYHNFPLRWNLSEMENTIKPPRSMPRDLAATPAAIKESPIPVGDSFPLFSRDPFPKLRTFPVFWDLSR